MRHNPDGSVAGRSRRPRRRSRLAACVAISAAGLTSCGGDASSSKVPAASTSTTRADSATSTSTSTPEQAPAPTEPAAVTASTTTEEPCKADDGTGEDLRALITDDLPPPYEVAPDGAEDTGPFDLQRATDDVSPTDGEVLRDLRFRRGFSRLWYRIGSDEVDLRIYEFCEPEGATAYERHTFDRLTTQWWGFREIEAGPLPPDTVALLYGTAGTDGYVSLLRAHGPYLLLAGARSAGGESQESLVGRARMLLELQLAALS